MVMVIVIVFVLVMVLILVIVIVIVTVIVIVIVMVIRSHTGGIQVAYRATVPPRAHFYNQHHHLGKM